MSNVDDYKSIYKEIEEARKTVPVDLIGLSKRLGLEVKETPMDDQISGHLTICADDSRKPLIELNAIHVETRRRFTWAHEIGHWVLHRALIGDGVTDNKAYRATPELVNNSNITQFEETEANKFAAYLLMPDNLIAEMRASGLGLEDMAEKLKVSQQALRIKLGY